MTSTSWFARRVLRALLPKPIALRLRQEWLARAIAKGRGHREKEIFALPIVVKSGYTCWDIGANAGMYTVALASIARRVVSFEPVPHSFNTLLQSVRLARLTNVETHRLALSDTEGSARFSVPVDQGFYGGYYLAAFQDQGELEVETATIDGLIGRGWEEPDFIKCDVEGAEARVISGARELIHRRHPLWLLETFEEDVFRLMESLGYQAHVRAHDNTLAPVSAPLAEYRNYFFM